MNNTVEFEKLQCLFAIEVFNNGAWIPVCVGPISKPIQLLAENLEMASKIIEECKKIHLRKGLIPPNFRYRLLTKKESEERIIYYIRNKVQKQDVFNILKKGTSG